MTKVFVSKSGEVAYVEGRTAGITIERNDDPTVEVIQSYKKLTDKDKKDIDKLKGKEKVKELKKKLEK